MKLGEVEDYMCDNAEIYYPDVIYEISVDDEKEYIEAEGIKIVVPEFNLYMRDGSYMAYYEVEGEVVPDFSLVLVYDIDETDPNNWLYWEQGNLCTTLHNWLTHIGKSANVYDVECHIEIEPRE